MIDYATYCRIHALHKEGLKSSRIAQELSLDAGTVLRWLKQPSYTKRKAMKRSSRLDPHKGTIVRLLHHHDYSAMQILHRIREAGYEGGYTILKEFVRQVRLPKKNAYLRACPTAPKALT